MIMKMITELHGGLGHESGGEGKGGGGGGEERGRHIGLDKWTVKVPIWPLSVAFLFFSFILFCSFCVSLSLLPPFHSSPLFSYQALCKRSVGRVWSERSTECRPSFPLEGRRGVEGEEEGRREGKSRCL